MARTATVVGPRKGRGSTGKKSLETGREANRVKVKGSAASTSPRSNHGNGVTMFSETESMDWDSSKSSSASFKIVQGLKGKSKLRDETLELISNAEFHKKMKLDNDEAPEVEPKYKLDVSLKIKSLLVEDWAAIINKKKLATLPPRCTVDRILNDFNWSRNTGLKMDYATLEFSSGIRDYFNKMLGDQLLYPFERHQYNMELEKAKEGQTEEELLNSPMLLSSIYGGIHLLRLMIKFETILSFSELDERTFNLFREYFGHFMEFFEKNIEKYVSPADYEKATRDYERAAFK